MLLAVDYRKGINYNNFNNVEYIILYLEDYSLDSSVTLSINELNEILRSEELNKKYILILEGLYNNTDLLEIKNILLSIDTTKLSKISFSDLGLYELLTELKLNDKALFRSPTILTSLNDINNYISLGMDACVSSEIHSDELKYIVNNSNKSLFIDLFGQNIIFYSRRHLISLYKEYFNLDISPNDVDYTLIEELRNTPYPIKETKNNTLVFEPYYYALDDELSDLTNDTIGIIHLNDKITDTEALSILSAYNTYINDMRLGDLKKVLYNQTIKVYKGAYDIQSVLLKKGECNE